MAANESTGDGAADGATVDTPARAKNFIRQLIDADLTAGKHARVVTRFPPEPNGYLHIGHAKAICVNFGIAADYEGTCHLRFDDTNPEAEDMEYVEAIQRDIRWLGFDWGDKLFFASDYYERLYEVAEGLIRDGKAYVDSLNEEEIRAYRGTVTEAGRESPHRARSIGENLDLFRRMRAGEFDEGAHVLRAKIDMAAANMKMRDPLLYRIKKTPHYRRGDAWCLYPMYDFTHCLSDAFEGITHSLCTLEFENNRELYDWVIAEANTECRPEQTEYARLNLTFTVMSKRKLRRLVEEGRVSGWDDPRMPTIAGLRRRGCTAEAIRDLCERVGVARNNAVSEIELFEHSLREDLNHKAPRVMGILRPLKVVIESWPEGETDELDASHWPHDVPKEGSRKVPFGRELWIERDDFREAPPSAFHRLAPGREVRLRYGYVVKCTSVVKDEATGEVTEVRCTHDPDSRGGNTADGRKVKGTIHWVSAAHALDAEARLYDRLFTVERPDGDDTDFIEHLNPDSLETVTAKLEPSLAGTEPGTHVQLERLGYFFTDPVDSTAERLVLNRTVSLRDSWKKLVDRATADAHKAPVEEAAPTHEDAEVQEAKRQEAAAREEAGLDGAAKARLARYADELAVSRDHARIIARSEEVSAFFEAALATGAPAQATANWVVTDVLREAKDRPLGELRFGGAELGALVSLIAKGTISGKIAKAVFEVLVADGGDPGAIVEARGLVQVSDRGALEKVVDETIAKNPKQAEQYRGGNQKLAGFFVGQVMKATKGRANPKLANELVRERLAAL